MANFAKLLNYGKNIFAVSNLYETSTKMNMKILIYFFFANNLKMAFCDLKMAIVDPKMAIVDPKMAIFCPKWPFLLYNLNMVNSFLKFLICMNHQLRCRRKY